jgi:transcriptional regulator with XRE-family HTH domain
MTAEKHAIDVPLADSGEAFEGELPRVAGAGVTEPGWVALSALANSGSARARTAAGAAMAGAFVRTMRIGIGMSQTQLSQASGIAQSVISDIERGAGKVGPGFATMLRLAAACGMEIGFAPVVRDRTGRRHDLAVDPKPVRGAKLAGERASQSTDDRTADIPRSRSRIGRTRSTSKAG